ncbi:galanin receptor 2a-like [Haliotis rubra]|uniref:galanin receptor 2a-like n=1 Tax=Haliotis rubra TaxID=36100 RepID=UPI001EE52269|nr:galanin receptor 2a-like [Haliotis rubra]XP_046577211.1 galanin receptor 2a-like [Haliotis rubra]
MTVQHNISMAEINLSLCQGNSTSEDYGHLIRVSDIIKQFYIWVVFVVGFPGNIISAIVVTRMCQQRLTTSLFYVGLLAVVDNIAIVLKLVENQSQNRRLAMDDRSCRGLFFLGLVFSTYANWILTTVAMERFLAVRYPFKMAVMWTVRKGLVIISCVFVLLCLIHLHLFWTVIHYEGYTCTLTLEGPSFKAWFYVGSFVYAILPASCLFICNILIIIYVRRSANNRRTLSENHSTTVATRRLDAQITKMLVIVAAVFILLSFPRCIFLVANGYWNPTSCSIGEARKYFLDVLTTNIADSNHAVNFYLYFLAGRRFRHAYSSIIRDISFRKRSVEKTPPHTDSELRTRQ